MKIVECIELGSVECSDLNAGILRGDCGIIELGFVGDCGIIELGFVKCPDLNAGI